MQWRHVHVFEAEETNVDTYVSNVLVKIKHSLT